LSVFKLVPAIFALNIFNKVSGVLHRAAEGDCADSSDKITGLVFSDLDEETRSSIDSLTTQVVIDSMNITMAIMMAIFANMKSGLSEYEGMKGGGGGGEKRNDGGEKTQVEMIVVEGNDEPQ
jgi:hypothetical protein